jgi:hypothetical protein
MWACLGPTVIRSEEEGSQGVLQTGAATRTLR